MPALTETITRVVLDNNGTTEIQTDPGIDRTPPTPTPTRSTTDNANPVSITNVTISDGTTNTVLDVFNFEGVIVELGELATYSPPSTGIGVNFSGSANVDLTDGVSPFQSAMEDALRNTNIKDYVFYDGKSTSGLTSTIDYKVKFRRALESTDFVLMQERNGNTYFQLSPLDINGDVISGANIIQFASSNNDPSTGYSWNTGIADSGYQPDQPMYYSVASISNFFNDTSVPAEDQNVFGFAVNNQGNADTKFYGLSDDTFSNNPIDISVPVTIPEAGSSLFFAGLILARSFARRRPRG